MASTDRGHSHWIGELDQNGFVIVPTVFSQNQLATVQDQLHEALKKNSQYADSVRARSGSVYAARNLTDFFPAARSIWQTKPLSELLTTILGTEFGLVRGLYFDKPPDRSWSLPWHKDLTIAVKRNDLASDCFSKPTMKSGVAHVEAPQSLLKRMLTVRIHLDAMTEENGPLEVISGSHEEGKRIRDMKQPPTSIVTHAGDVLLIRPLVTHCSGNSVAGTDHHRRVIHLEFAPNRQLPDHYEWNWFEQPAPT